MESGWLGDSRDALNGKGVFETCGVVAACDATAKVTSIIAICATVT